MGKRGVLEGINDPVQDEEVVARLSFTVWKSFNRILEEVFAARKSQNRVVDFIITGNRLPVRSILRALEREGFVERKLKNELPETEMHWAVESQGGDDSPERLVEMGINPNIPFYRSCRNGSPRNDEEALLLGSDVDPVLA